MFHRGSVGRTYVRRLFTGRSSWRSFAVPEPWSGPWSRSDNDTAVEYRGLKQVRRTSRGWSSMVDPNRDELSDAVRRSADNRIRLEALRQLHSVDVDDEDGRIEPLPQFESSGMFDDLEEQVEERRLDPGQDGESAWDELRGRFVPNGDCC